MHKEKLFATWVIPYYSELAFLEGELAAGGGDVVPFGVTTGVDDIVCVEHFAEGDDF